MYRPKTRAPGEIVRWSSSGWSTLCCCSALSSSGTHFFFLVSGAPPTAGQSVRGCLAERRHSGLGCESLTFLPLFTSAVKTLSAPLPEALDVLCEDRLHVNILATHTIFHLIRAHLNLAFPSPSRGKGALYRSAQKSESSACLHVCQGLKSNSKNIKTGRFTMKLWNIFGQFTPNFPLEKRVERMTNWGPLSRDLKCADRTRLL